MSQNLKYGLFVLVLALQCLYWGLGTRPIHKTQEIRVAETAREMVASGDWLTPYFNGQIRLRKPPLAYWVTATSYVVFGAATEFSARFASATFALGTAFLLLFWLRKTLGMQAALAAVLCFISSYIALRFLRSAETDAMLIFFVAAACFTVYRLLFEDCTRGRVLLLYACMGLGFLTKGPAAIAIPLALLLTLSIRTKDYHLLRRLADPAGLALLLVLAFGWYLAIYLKHADIATYWVAEEVDATYIGGGAHTNPFYWYLPACFAFFAPWSLFIIPGAIWLFRSRPLPPLVGFAAIWFALTFLILSLNPAKQTQYALLLSPPLAILLGHYLASARETYARINTWIFIFIFAGAAVAAVFFLVKENSAFDAQAMLVISGIALIPLIAAFILRIDVRTHYKQILLAGLVSAVWIQGLGKLYGPQSEEALTKRFALVVASYQPLYSYGESNVPIAFYVRSVVPALLNSKAVQTELTRAQGPIYIVADAKRPVETAGAELVLRDGNLVLWKVGAAQR